MSKEVLKTCLKTEFYEQNKLQLNEDLFNSEQKDIFKILRDAHEKYHHDLSQVEILELWKTKNPVATNSDLQDFTLALDIVCNSETIHDGIANEIITSLWEKNWARKCADAYLRISEGDPNAQATIDQLMLQKQTGYSPMDFGEDVTKDLRVLLAQQSDDNAFKFNISSLSQHVYGVRRKSFSTFFATPETGKTAFIASICCGPGGFMHQDGCKVGILANEEDGGVTMVRCCQAMCGITTAEIPVRIDEVQETFLSFPNFRIKNVGGWDFQKVEAWIQDGGFDVVVIDQGDKIHINGTFNASHERIRTLYTNFRELAKRQDCALIVISQASADAKSKTKLTTFDMENSKIGKSAETDLIIGIGKHPSEEHEDPDYTRFLTVSKNKLNGWHGTVVCHLNHQISRYEV